MRRFLNLSLPEARESMRILAIDTATEACSVALQDPEACYAQFELCPREHTQRILPMVQDILERAEIRLADIDVLAFGRGPGSFTGVRIGIGIAQGLALGAGLPMVGVSTLATMAQGAWRRTGATRVLAAIDARMGEVYWAEYVRDESGVWQGESSEAVLKPDAVAERLAGLTGEWAIVGTGWHAWPDMASQSGLQIRDGETTLPEAEDMLPLALLAFNAGKAVAVEESEPVYLRNEVTWKKLPGRE